VAIALFGVAAGLVAMLAVGKIKKSPDAVVLVKSGAYRAVTAVGVVVTSFVGSIMTIYALGVTLATLFALQDGLPWAAYYLGQFLPTLLLGGTLIGTAFLIMGFAKAKVTSLVVWLVPFIVACVGLVLVVTAVGVKSHSNDAGTIFGVTRSSSSTYNYSNYYDY